MNARQASLNNYDIANAIVEYLHNGGNPQLKAIAEHLNEKGFITKRCKRMNDKFVFNFCKRFGINRHDPKELLFFY